MAEARSDHSDRSKAERIERLRSRLSAYAGQARVPLTAPLVAVLQGILDLLADEL